MVSAAFGARAPDAGSARWVDRRAAAPELDVPGQGSRLVIVVAHPDDETLAAGGLLSRAAGAGAHISVVIATDGEASHPGSGTHSPRRLATIRRAEAAEALAVVAPAAVLTFLGLPDSALAGSSARLRAALEPLLTGADVVVSTWERDGHPDHEACATAVADVLRAGPSHAAHWRCPIWAWQWARPEDLPEGEVFRSTLGADALAAKRKALRCYVSQHAPLSDDAGDEAIVTAAMLAHFDGPEEIFLVAPRSPAGSNAPARSEAEDPAYFAGLYEQSDDPWGLADRFYEQRKRAALMAALPRRRFLRAFEPGCATGQLSRLLAGRCAELVAWDTVESAVRQATQALREFPGAEVVRGAIPQEWPAGDFDLIVLSEVGYYCRDLDRLVASVWRSLGTDGVLVACHWRHEATMHPYSADTVHAALGAGRSQLVQHTEDDFLLQVWSTDGRSVAAVEGLLG